MYPNMSLAGKKEDIRESRSRTSSRLNQREPIPLMARTIQQFGLLGPVTAELGNQTSSSFGPPPVLMKTSSIVDHCDERLIMPNLVANAHSKSVKMLAQSKRDRYSQGFRPAKQAKSAYLGKGPTRREKSTEARSGHAQKISTLLENKRLTGLLRGSQGSQNSQRAQSSEEALQQSINEFNSSISKRLDELSSRNNCLISAKVEKATGLEASEKGRYKNSLISDRHTNPYAPINGKTEEAVQTGQNESSQRASVPGKPVNVRLVRTFQQKNGHIELVKETIQSSATNNFTSRNAVTGGSQGTKSNLSDALNEATERMRLPVDSNGLARQAALLLNNNP